MIEHDRITEIVEQAQAQAGCGPWVDQIEKVITPEERRIVLAKWKTMDGTASFYTALLSFWERCAYCDRPGVVRQGHGMAVLRVCREHQQQDAAELRRLQLLAARCGRGATDEGFGR